MKTLSKVGLLALMSMTAMECHMLAQLPALPAASGCENSRKVLAPKNPRMGAGGDIVPGQAIVQMKLALDEKTILKVVEYPRSGKDLDSYNSTIVIQRGQEPKKFSLKELIKGGEFLRLVEMARVCGSPDQGSIFLAFEAGSTGAAEGFAVVRYSPAAVDVQAFPMANQGRIVVQRTTPNEVELWSASGSAGGIDCDACKKHYVVRDCNVGQDSVECKQQPGAGEVLSPDKFMRARIEVR